MAKPPDELRHPVMLDITASVMPNGTLVLGGVIAAESTRQIVVPETQSRILVPAESPAAYSAPTGTIAYKNRGDALCHPGKVCVKST